MERKGMSYSEAGKLGALKSKESHNRARELRMEEYYKKPNKCLGCGSVIPYDKRKSNKYCSRSCAAHVNNQKYPKRRNVKEQKICPVCGKIISRKQNIYCSIECANAIKFINYKNAIQCTGIVPAVAHGEVSRQRLKRYLIELHGERCSICGITKWNGQPAPLIVDHIDGNCLNNDVNNFRLVCGNCDMQLPTYKSKNKKGRAWRRKYYK